MHVEQEGSGTQHDQGLLGTIKIAKSEQWYLICICFVP